MPSRVQELAANAGQVVELPPDMYSHSSENVTQTTSHAAGTSVGGCDTLARDLETDADAVLAWKVDVTGLQVAMLSQRKWGTALFAAHKAEVSSSRVRASSRVDVRFLFFLFFDLSFDLSFNLLFFCQADATCLH